MPLPDPITAPTPPVKAGPEQSNPHSDESQAQSTTGAGRLPVMRPASLPLEAPEILATIIVEIAGANYAMALAGELIVASDPAVSR